jgi:hypothetical protein
LNTLKRAYVSAADLRSAAALLDHRPAWIADYNGLAPRSALGYQARLEYRRQRQAMVTD